MVRISEANQNPQRGRLRGMQTEIAVTCLFPGRWERSRVKKGRNLKEERFKKCRPLAVIPQGLSAKCERRQANRICH